jgi:hypothetical protein
VITHSTALGRPCVHLWCAAPLCMRQRLPWTLKECVSNIWCWKAGKRSRPRMCQGSGFTVMERVWACCRQPLGDGVTGKNVGRIRRSCFTGSHFLKEMQNPFSLLNSPIFFPLIFQPVFPYYWLLNKLIVGSMSFAHLRTLHRTPFLWRRGRLSSCVWKTPNKGAEILQLNSDISGRGEIFPK